MTLLIWICVRTKYVRVAEKISEQLLSAGIFLNDRERRGEQPNRSYPKACKYLRPWISCGNLDRGKHVSSCGCWFIRGEEPKDALNSTFSLSLSAHMHIHDVIRRLPQARASIHSAAHWRWLSEDAASCTIIELELSDTDTYLVL